MAKTQPTGRQIKDGSIQRDDLDVVTPGQAVVTKIIAGTGVTITSTGVDTGTGDVTVNATGTGTGIPTIKIGSSRRTRVPANAVLFLSHFENQLRHTNVPITFEKDGTITDVTVAMNRHDNTKTYDVNLYRDMRNTPILVTTLASIPTNIEELAVTGLSIPVLASEEYGIGFIRTSPVANVNVPVGNINDGQAGPDGATGPGYIMYSATNLFVRFAGNPPYNGGFGQNSNQLILVRNLTPGVWQYTDNFGWFTFTPDPDDRLLATVDMTADTIAPITTLSTIDGIEAGFITSDLTFQADFWSGLTGTVFSNGEFYVSGTFFEIPGVAATSRFNREVVYLTVQLP